MSEIEVEEPDAPIVLATDDPEVVSAMQDDLIALIRAWTDRGIRPHEGGTIMAAMGHMILLRCDFSMGDVVKLLCERWTAAGGKL